MKKVTLYIFSLILLLGATSCNDWLTREPKDTMNDEQVFSSETTINSYLAGLYQRLPDAGCFATDFQTSFDEGMWGGNAMGTNTLVMSFDFMHYYDYNLIRDINYFIETLPKEVSSTVDQSHVDYYLAEARFIRAYVYFEMVKRMGGVPLIEKLYTYDSSMTVDDLVNFCEPRTSEAAMYDYIAKEMDAVMNVFDLGNAKVSTTRATKGACLAIKARAMLYAGSLAKYNSSSDTPVTLASGAVGIPASRANEYYQKCLDACEDLMELKVNGAPIYGLYQKSSDLTQNFVDLFLKKDDNPEIIFARDYSSEGNTHTWTSANIPYSQRSIATGGAEVNPGLNLVEAFEFIDNRDGKLKTRVNEDDANSDYIYYDNIGDIFNNKDPRMAATIMVPDSTFNSKQLDIQAGLAIWNESTGKYTLRVGDITASDASKNLYEGIQITGSDGPSSKDYYITHTGFYVRKFMEESTAAVGGSSTASWPRYRYAEVLLNAAEAAYELGLTDKVYDYFNQVRTRAGLNKIEAPTMEDIRHERQVEFAFESLRYFDVKRWRIADKLYDGLATTETATISSLFPYKVYRPGSEYHNKYIFVKSSKAPLFNAPRKFSVGNYYSAFTNDELTKNPKLEKNPYQN